MTTQVSNILVSTDANSSQRYLRLPEVLDRVGVSWITLLRWEKQGLFPKRRKLGHRVVAWLESEIDQWCKERPVARSSQKGSV
jgi:prophage regulatory protein